MGEKMSIDVYDVKLSKGYQFTLQAKTRKKHDLKPGQMIQVIDLGKEIVLLPEKKGNLKGLIGKFKVRKNTDIVSEHDLVVAGFD